MKKKPTTNENRVAYFRPVTLIFVRQVNEAMRVGEEGKSDYRGDKDGGGRHMGRTISMRVRKD